ncbi:Ankyrin repeat domain-containing protein 33B [Plecturocebus cupreus]
MDRSGRTGLIVACYHGFVDPVVALAECPHVHANSGTARGTQPRSQLPRQGLPLPVGTEVIDTVSQPCLFRHQHRLGCFV